MGELTVASIPATDSLGRVRGYSSVTSPRSNPGEGNSERWGEVARAEMCVRNLCAASYLPR